MSILLTIFAVIVIAILLILAVDYLAGAAGGDGRLYLLLKALIVIGAALYVLSKLGVV